MNTGTHLTPSAEGQTNTVAMKGQRWDRRERRAQPFTLAPFPFEGKPGPEKRA